MLCKEFEFHLAQEFFWWSPSKLPTPAEWVTVRRIRVKDAGQLRLVAVADALAEGQQPARALAIQRCNEESLEERVQSEASTERSRH